MASRIAKLLRLHFPHWMDIRTKDDSIGAQFLETFGLQLDEVQECLNEFMHNRFIGTAKLDEVSTIYKVSVHKPVIENSIEIKTSDDVILSQAMDLRTFYRYSVSHYIVDYDKAIIYLREHHDTIYVNGIPYQTESHQVWNVFDEFGMLLNLYRIKDESNLSFKNRILDVFVNPPSDTRSGLMNHLARSLNIDKSLIKIQSTQELEETEIDINGHVSPRFIAYIEKLNKVVPFTWGTMRWDESYWDTYDKIGLDYLPHIFNPDMSMWKNEEFQSGIGDGDDLKIIAPEEKSEEQTFTYSVGLKGLIDRTEELFTEHQLKFKVYAEGQMSTINQAPKKILHTVVASENIPFTYSVNAYKNYERVYDGTFSSAYEKSNVEVVSGEKFMGSNNRYLKIRVKMNTNNEDITPLLNSLTVKWIDTVGGNHDLLFTTAENFTQNTATIDTNLDTVETTAGGSLQLGKGTYSKNYDTVNSWDEGIKTNVQASRVGLSLILPRS